MMDMTSPSSYEFYSARNPLRERKEGTDIYRVFITEKKITVYSKVLVKTSKSGVLFEKIAAQKTFSRHENRNGTQYLKRFTKSPGGSINDTSLDVLTVKLHNNSTSSLSDNLPQPCRDLVERTILSWFGLEDKDVTLLDVQDELLFPILKDTEFPRDLTCAKTLSTLQGMTGTVTKALRENDTWSDFILELGHPTVHTVDDFSIIKDHPNELLPLAGMELPPLSVMYAKNKHTLLNVSSAFTALDLSLLRFMFKYLPYESRFEGLQAMFDLSRMHFNIPHELSFRSYRRPISLEGIIKQIPSNRRVELAEKLLGKLVSKSVEGFKTAVFQQGFLVTQLAHTFRYWFAQEISEPKLQSQLTVEDIDARLTELFGSALAKKQTPAQFHIKEDLVFCSLSTQPGTASTLLYGPNPFVALFSLGKKKTPKAKGIKHHDFILNGFVGDDRVFVPVYGELYSLDDLMQTIENGVEALDSKLVKMGRKVTPENRAAYLTLRSRERDFKNTWKYYDLGVTDVTKILALKKAKITKKDEIQTFNELPDEMFYELTAMAAGLDSMEMTNAS
jgi:hypothetical protein